MKALISVFDKSGIIELCEKLISAGVELVSTGGTAKSLSDSGLPVQQISELTGFPEILDGRVKTLHPSVHGGILSRRDKPEHAAQLGHHQISNIDIIVVNLYPFQETIAKPTVTFDEAIENIDIGGPTLLRAAAKNHEFVVVLSDPNDYDWVQKNIAANTFSKEERRWLAAKAFQHVALYDTIIAQWLRPKDQRFTEEKTLGFKKVSDLRYGENPHQHAALYASVPADGGLVEAEQLHGKELSFNNILDANAAWTTVTDFPEPTVTIIKHTNPCGLASDTDQPEAYKKANSGDPVSAYGGIVGFNRTVTADTAKEMRSVFYEIVIAPDYEPEALDLLKKKRDLRILKLPLPSPKETTDLLQMRKVSGGILLQTEDKLSEDPSLWTLQTKRTPTKNEQKDLEFAWKAVKHIKSNAIVLVKNQALVGMGAGQPNRVTSVHLALRAAGETVTGSVLASDAFFPFPDGIELAAAQGVTVVVQPGGSIRDSDVIDSADKADIAMLFTGVRHFQH